MGRAVVGLRRESIGPMACDRLTFASSSDKLESDSFALPLSVFSAPRAVSFSFFMLSAFLRLQAACHAVMRINLALCVPIRVGIRFERIV